MEKGSILRYKMRTVCWLCPSSPLDLVHEFMHFSAFHKSVFLKVTNKHPLGSISINTSLKDKSPDPYIVHVEFGGKKDQPLDINCFSMSHGDSNINNSGSDCYTGFGYFPDCGSKKVSEIIYCT